MSDDQKQTDEEGLDRREFAAKAGKLALLAPAVTVLLSTTMTSNAIASSGGGGNGGSSGPRPPSPPPPPARPRPRWNIWDFLKKLFGRG